MNKRKCVLGVLKTEAGLKIKEEMLSWLSPIYDVITVEVDPPNDIEFELPFIKKACEVSIESNEPVLYLHTKGAAMQNNAQPIVRNMWKHEFGVNHETYFNMVNINEPCCASIIASAKNKICWYNGFVLNNLAAKQILKILTPHTDRYWFEQQMLAEANVKVIGNINADDGNTCWNLTYNYKPVTKNGKIAVVVLVKNEKPYIEEWLKYHTNLGVDKFFIINNDNIEPVGNEEIISSELEKELSNKYPCQFYQLRGQDALSIAGKQRGVLSHFYFNVIKPSNEFEWVTFIDIDEFLYFGGKNIKEYLNQSHFNDTDIIHLNWRCYGDNDHIYSANDTVQNRFTKEAPLNVIYNSIEAAKGITENMFVKSIFRVSDKRMLITNPHTIFIENGICRRSNGILSDCRYAAEILSTDDCHVKHYITKSLEEFINRRCINATDVANTPIPAKTRLEWYFNLNKKTPEKVQYIKERLGIEV